MKSKICAVVVALFSAIQICRPDPLDVWTWRNPLPTGQDFSSITYGNGLFAAVMFNGKEIYTSPDSINWAPAYWVTNFLSSVSFGNGSFVATEQSWVKIQGNYYAVVHSSSDGVHWTKHNIPVPGPDYSGRYVFYGLNAVGCGDGIFVVGGQCYDPWLTYYYPILFTSPDLVNWSWKSFPTNSEGGISAITYGNGRFVAAAGTQYGGYTFTSPDGANWAVRSQGTNRLYSLTYGNGLFAAVWQSSGTITSPDGVNWTPSSPGPTLSPYLTGMAYGNGVFVAVGEGYDPAQTNSVAFALTSSDGSAWVAHYSAAKNGVPRAVAYGNGRFVAGGDSGLVIASPDGTNWTQRSSAVTTATLRAVTYANGQFVAAGNEIVTSTDGANWVWRSSQGPISGLAYGNGQFVGVGSYGTIFTSTNAINWTYSG